MWLDILEPSIQIEISTIILNENNYCSPSKDFKNEILYFQFGYKYLSFVP